MVPLAIVVVAAASQFSVARFLIPPDCSPGTQKRDMVEVNTTVSVIVRGASVVVKTLVTVPAGRVSVVVDLSA